MWIRASYEDIKMYSLLKNLEILNNYTVIYSVPEEGSLEYNRIKDEDNENIIWLVDNHDVSLYNDAYSLGRLLKNKKVWICPMRDVVNNKEFDNHQIVKSIVKCIPLEISETSWHVIIGIKSLECKEFETLQKIIGLTDLPEVIYLEDNTAYRENYIRSWPSYKVKPLKDNGLYVITGGTGRVARSMIKAIGELVSANIVLLGRTDSDHIEVERIPTRNKVNLRYMSLDIADQDSVEELFGELRKEYVQRTINITIHIA